MSLHRPRIRLNVVNNAALSSQIICQQCGKEHNILLLTSVKRKKKGAVREKWCNGCLKRHEKRRASRIAYQVVHREKIKQRWTDILEGMGYLHCHKCGYTKCRSAIEYHHIDPKTKTMLISRQVRRYPTDAVIEELKKCIPLCANCHREVHNGHLNVPTSPLSVVTDHSGRLE